MCTIFLDHQIYAVLATSFIHPVVCLTTGPQTLSKFLYKKQNKIQKPQKDCTRTAIIDAHAASFGNRSQSPETQLRRLSAQ